jgi:hypothetical protein
MIFKGKGMCRIFTSEDYITLLGNVKCQINKLSCKETALHTVRGQNLKNKERLLFVVYK